MTPVPHFSTATRRDFPPAYTTAQDRAPDWFQQKKKAPDGRSKNPFKKNRWTVKALADDLADTLNAQNSWKYLLKLIWAVSEEMEEKLVWAASWVREEVHCNRCYAPMGLFDWKLTEMGVHPFKA